jgi:hypothetical protein
MFDDYARLLNLIGLTLGLIGVLILFRWGMPFRVNYGVATPITSDAAPPRAKALSHVYLLCGWIGLCLLILGWALQVIAILTSGDD